MKILNLYAGIGGNRKLWGDEHQITAIEYKPEIAKIYKEHFPNDTVHVEDAHDFLVRHYSEFDFIWSSPPCPTHSQLGRLRVLSNSKKTGAYMSVAKYPDMSLYQEIILLKHFFKGKWVVENVIAYYEPLIRPTEIQRHHFWSNFLIPDFNVGTDGIENGTVKDLSKRMGYDVEKLKGVEKRLVLRNCVHPMLGKHILHYAMNPIEHNKPLWISAKF